MCGSQIPDMCKIGPRFGTWPYSNPNSDSPRIRTARTLPADLWGAAKRCQDILPRGWWLAAQMEQAYGIQHSELLVIWLRNQDLPVNQPSSAS